MKCNINYKDLTNKFGIQKIYKLPVRFTPTYVIGVANNQNITVSNMLNQIQYIVRFIKANFDVDQKKYKETLQFLKLCELRFQNKSSMEPKKKMAHFTVEVFHEIKDMYAKNEAMRRENENNAIFMDMLIDMFIHE